MIIPVGGETIAMDISQKRVSTPLSVTFGGFKLFMDHQIITLRNGIRLIHRHTDSPVAHCGLLLNAGTRDELPHEQGIAHFIEHVIFKGTKKRSAIQVINRLEDVGGDLNAYTAKEETCFHASFLSEYYERTFELLSDILFNPSFPAQELEKEKEVVVDEINSYLDSPSEQIFDDFEGIVFDPHPLGRNILGTPEHVRSFTRKDVLHFIERQYFTNEIVLSSIGNLSPDRVKRLAEKYFGDHPGKTRDVNRESVKGFTPRQVRESKDTHQAHVVIGGPAYDLYDSRRLALFLLINLLGGPGMNSRLNLSLREKHGLAYNAEASYTPFFDSGIFTVYFGTFDESLEKCLRIVRKEMKAFSEKRLSDSQLTRAKRQLHGQMALAQENNLNQMLGMAKSLLVYNKVESISEIREKIERISSAEILEIANDLFRPDRLSMLIYE